MSEESARQRKEQHETQSIEWLKQIRTQLDANQKMSLDANATPDQLQRRVSEASSVLVEVLPFVAEIEASTSSTVSPSQLTAADPAAQLVIEAQRLRHSTEQLSQEHKQAARAQDLMTQTYRLLDLLNHTVDASLSSFPLSLQPAIDELEGLKVS
jgi:hypothetical protein